MTLILHYILKQVCLMTTLFVYIMSSLPYPSTNLVIVGAHGGVVVKALHYKPAGRGFDS